MTTLDDFLEAEEQRRETAEDRYRVAFEVAVAKLGMVTPEARLHIAAVLRELIPSVDPLDETVSKRGLGFVASLLEHGLGSNGVNR